MARPISIFSGLAAMALSACGRYYADSPPPAPPPRYVVPIPPSTGGSGSACATDSDCPVVSCIQPNGASTTTQMCNAGTCVAPGMACSEAANCNSPADCAPIDCLCSDGTTVIAQWCDQGGCDSADLICPMACPQSGNGDWNGTIGTSASGCSTDADCAPVQCTCADGTTTYSQFCAIGECQDPASTCPDACSGNGGW